MVVKSNYNMKNVCFIKSKKENEKRRAIVLEDFVNIKNKKHVYFEEGYGTLLGYSDQDIINDGFNILNSNDIYKCDIIVDPKIGDSNDLDKMKNKIVFGWIHATQNYDITQKFIDNKITGYAFEKMFENNIHSFYMNNQIAGKAAVLHAMLLYGSNFNNKKIAIIGNGNTSKGVQEVLNRFDLKYDVYDYYEEALLKKNLLNYDIFINCILWDTNRTDHIIYKDDLLKFKKDSLIIDVSCDKNGAIESSVPTTIDEPIYYYNNVMHYVVDHTPSLLYKDSSKSISKVVSKYIDDLILENENLVLDKALIIKNGIIIDKEINEFQNRK